jgi:hypothetical protein
MDISIHQLTAETRGLLEQLEGTVARLAAVLDSIAPDAQTRVMDEEACAWVQQSIEDISATLRGLALMHSKDAPAPAPLHALTDPAQGSASATSETGR